MRLDIFKTKTEYDAHISVNHRRIRPHKTLREFYDQTEATYATTIGTHRYSLQTNSGTPYDYADMVNQLQFENHIHCFYEVPLEQVTMSLIVHISGAYIIDTGELFFHEDKLHYTFMTD